MSARGHKASERGKAVHCARPKVRIADIIGHDIGAMAIGEFHDLSRQILGSVINAVIGAEMLDYARFLNA